jgi:hypothetical protein
MNNVNKNLFSTDSPQDCVDYIADSGCTEHYVPEKVEIKDETNTKNIYVTLPNGSSLKSKTSGTLNITGVSDRAKNAYKFSTFQNALLSIGQLCDDGCTAILKMRTILILNKENIPILSGKRETKSGMWMIPIPNKPKVDNVCNRIAVKGISSIHHLIRYYHATCYSPVKSTWLKAIKKGHFTSWPGLTYDAVNHHLSTEDATLKGHMKMKRQSVKQKEERENNDRHNEVMVKVLETKEIFTDQMGRFPIKSSSGVQYIFLMYHTDSNAILVRPMRNKTASEIIKAFNSAFELLEKVGPKPTFHRLDNEASKLMIKEIEKKGLVYQLVPPNNHRSNKAERAIQTFKAHFISGLCTVDASFPMHTWDKLLPQAEKTLNMLRTSKINPMISAHDQIYGVHSFLATPMAPPGI